MKSGGIPGYWVGGVMRKILHFSSHYLNGMRPDEYESLILVSLRYRKRHERFTELTTDVDYTHCKMAFLCPTPIKMFSSGQSRSKTPGSKSESPLVLEYGNKTFRPQDVSPLVVSPLVVSPLFSTLVVSPPHTLVVSPPIPFPP